jgi:hypothetical protein
MRLDVAPCLILTALFAALTDPARRRTDLAQPFAM